MTWVNVSLLAGGGSTGGRKHIQKEGRCSAVTTMKSCEAHEISWRAGENDGPRKLTPKNSGDDETKFSVVVRMTAVYRYHTPHRTLSDDDYFFAVGGEKKKITGRDAPHELRRQPAQHKAWIE